MNIVTIFVVDDEKFIQDIYKLALEFNGYQVVDTAYDGEEAVEKFRSMTPEPDIIIMDQRMPRKDGITATREILAMSSHVKIIFSSADATVREDAFKAGAKGFLHKPFRMGTLMKEIKRVLSS